jgi:hypothetical protein
VNSGDIKVQKKKKKRTPLVTERRRKNMLLWLLEGSSVVRLWLLCCNTVCKKSNSKLLLLPLRCKRSKQWGPCIVNPVFFFTKQLKSTVYLKRSRNRSRVNKQTLSPQPHPT